MSHYPVVVKIVKNCQFFFYAIAVRFVERSIYYKMVRLITAIVVLTLLGTSLAHIKRYSKSVKPKITSCGTSAGKNKGALRGSD
jgi:hypothetical protein